MKFRKLYLLILLVAGLAYSQKAHQKIKSRAKPESTIHEMLIFKWCKDGNTDIKRYIKIDSLGNVIIKGQNFLGKVDMKAFTACVHKFIKNENVEKVKGSDGVAPLADIPDKNKQNIYISILLTEDYIKGKHLKNKSYYSWSRTGLVNIDNDYPLFKYLPEKDAGLLKRFLE